MNKAVNCQPLGDVVTFPSLIFSKAYDLMLKKGQDLMKIIIVPPLVWYLVGQVKHIFFLQAVLATYAILFFRLFFSFFSLKSRYFSSLHTIKAKSILRSIVPWNNVHVRQMHLMRIGLSFRLRPCPQYKKFIPTLWVSSFFLLFIPFLQWMTLLHMEGI